MSSKHATFIFFLFTFIQSTTKLAQCSHEVDKGQRSVCAGVWDWLSWATGYCKRADKICRNWELYKNILCEHSYERSQNLGILFKHSFLSNKHYSFLYIQSTRQYVCYPELTSIYRSCAQLTLSTAYAAPYSQFLFSHSPRNARDHTRSSRKYHSQENSNSDQTPRTDGDTEWHPHVHN